MAIINAVTKSLLFVTILIQMSSSQSFYPITGFPDSSQPLETEILCKDLASAIQGVIISKMKRNALKAPVISPCATEVTNSGCQCPFCANKYKNSLTRILGMPNSVNNYAQSPNSAVITVNQATNLNNNVSPVAANVVNTGLGQIIDRNGCPYAGQSILQAMGTNQDVYKVSNAVSNQMVARNACPFAGQSILQALGSNQNVYKVSDLGLTNAGLGNLGQRSVPSNTSNKIVEYVIVKGTPTGNGYNTNALVS